MVDTVAVYQAREHHRSRVVCAALASGARAAGLKVIQQYEGDYRRPIANVAAFYGLEGRLADILREYSETPGLRAVYVDLGYWGRREGGRFTGYHKAVVNARHPMAYFQRRQHRPDRFARFNLFPAPWRPAEGAGHILLAGMGDKGAQAEGFEPEQWERQAIAALREHTNRPIYYRPKPSWKKAKPIEGVAYAPPHVDIAQFLNGAWAVVTHHSNVAVDALLAGVPVICLKGVASLLGSRNFSDIERLPRPEGRLQWCADIAYTQWSVAEIAAGLCWQHLIAEGLLA